MRYFLLLLFLLCSCESSFLINKRKDVVNADSTQIAHVSASELSKHSKASEVSSTSVKHEIEQLEGIRTQGSIGIDSLRVGMLYSLSDANGNSFAYSLDEANRLNFIATVQGANVTRYDSSSSRVYEQELVELQRRFDSLMSTRVASTSKQVQVDAEAKVKTATSFDLLIAVGVIVLAAGAVWLAAKKLGLG